VRGLLSPVSLGPASFSVYRAIEVMGNRLGDIVVFILGHCRKIIEAKVHDRERRIAIRLCALWLAL